VVPPVGAFSKRSRRAVQSSSVQAQAVGQLSEEIVAQWLSEQGYEILHRRWHCRWGELDVVAQFPSPATIVFVEVKARSDQNWDLNGLLAVTPKKREKLWKTAEFFLAQNPTVDAFPCRFDVALVHYQIDRQSLHSRQTNSDQTGSHLVDLAKHQPIAPVENTLSLSSFPNLSLQKGTPVAIGPYRFTLQNYLINVFD
jgi:putative endonuclease